MNLVGTVHYACACMNLVGTLHYASACAMPVLA